MTWQPIYAETASDHGFAPRFLPPLCYRCIRDEPAPDDHLCVGCRDEASANAENARYEAAMHHLAGDEGDTH